jgi:hypothetical protein
MCGRMCRVGCPRPWRARSMLRLSAVLSGRRLSFLKTSVIYLFSVSLIVVSRVGTETERRRCEDGIFLLKRTPIALRLLALSRVQPRRAFTSGRRGRGPERAEPDSESH